MSIQYKPDSLRFEPFKELFVRLCGLPTVSQELSDFY